MTETVLFSKYLSGYLKDISSSYHINIALNVANSSPDGQFFRQNHFYCTMLFLVDAFSLLMIMKIIMIMVIIMIMMIMMIVGDSDDDGSVAVRAERERGRMMDFWRRKMSSTAFCCSPTTKYNYSPTIVYIHSRRACPVLKSYYATMHCNGGSLWIRGKQWSSNVHDEDHCIHGGDFFMVIMCIVFIITGWDGNHKDT